MLGRIASRTLLGSRLLEVPAAISMSLLLTALGCARVTRQASLEGDPVKTAAPVRSSAPVPSGEPSLQESADCPAPLGPASAVGGDPAPAPRGGGARTVRGEHGVVVSVEGNAT